MVPSDQLAQFAHPPCMLGVSVANNLAGRLPSGFPPPDLPAALQRQKVRLPARLPEADSLATAFL
jgi:hypothetical protein